MTYAVSTTVITLDGDFKTVHQKLFHSNYKPSLAELVVATLLALFVLDYFVVGPVVEVVNECVYLATMINKLYHRRKVNINESTGVNAVANVKGINPNKSPAQILTAHMNSREKIEISWLDVFIFKYIKCNCYTLFKGTQFYTGKIIYEGEQRLKSDADLGNVLSQLRTANTVASCLLSKDGALMMKYQQTKLIDIVENANPRFADLDSEVHN